MAKRYRVTLTQAEREELEGITRRRSHKSRRVVNALILLNCDAGEADARRARNEEVAAILRVSTRKIERVKKRFVEEGLEAALGSRQGRRPYERKADGEFEARLLALSCSEPPEGYSRWSLRLLADRAVELEYVDRLSSDIQSHETVRRVLKNARSSRGRRSGG